MNFLAKPSERRGNDLLSHTVAKKKHEGARWNQWGKICVTWCVGGMRFHGAFSPFMYMFESFHNTKLKIEM